MAIVDLTPTKNMEDEDIWSQVMDQVINNIFGYENRDDLQFNNFVRKYLKRQKGIDE